MAKFWYEISGTLTIAPNTEDKVLDVLDKYGMSALDVDDGKIDVYFQGWEYSSVLNPAFEALGKIGAQGALNVHAQGGGTDAEYTCQIGDGMWTSANGVHTFRYADGDNPKAFFDALPKEVRREAIRADGHTANPYTVRGIFINDNLTDALSAFWTYMNNLEIAENGAEIGRLHRYNSISPDGTITIVGTIDFGSKNIAAMPDLLKKHFKRCVFEYQRSWLDARDGMCAVRLDYNGRDVISECGNTFVCFPGHTDEFWETLPFQLRDDISARVNNFEALLSRLPKSPDSAIRGLWSDGEQILCKTEAQANAIADLVEAMALHVTVHISHYDPKEDKRDNCVDKYTGWYAVYVD
jgi:hypothetical protein